MRMHLVAMGALLLWGGAAPLAAHAYNITQAHRLIIEVSLTPKARAHLAASPFTLEFNFSGDALPAHHAETYGFVDLGRKVFTLLGPSRLMITKADLASDRNDWTDGFKLDYVNTHSADDKIDCETAGFYYEGDVATTALLCTLEDEQSADVHPEVPGGATISWRYDSAEGALKPWHNGKDVSVVPEPPPPPPPPSAPAPPPPAAHNTLQPFPEHPPKPSQELVLPPSALTAGLGANPSLRAAGRRLVAALTATGYLQYKFYSVAGGFALVTRLEEFNTDGSPGPAESRFADPDATQPFSLANYIQHLFFAPDGYYRLIVFEVTDRAITTSHATLSPGQADDWLTDGGADKLPPIYDKMPVTPDHQITALIYEFHKHGHDPIATLIPSYLDASVHLTKSGLYKRLVGP